MLVGLTGIMRGMACGVSNMRLKVWIIPNYSGDSRKVMALMYVRHAGMDVVVSIIWIGV